MKISTIVVFLCLCFFSLSGQGYTQHAGGEIRFSQGANCRSNAQALDIKLRLRKNRKELLLNGAYENPKFHRSDNIVSFDFPLRPSATFPFESFYSISNYVDHDPNVSGIQYSSSNKDYNCGNQSYDFVEGYNHTGTDYALWPFPWYLYENDMVEVIAAESGMIIGKDDGNEDDHCFCDGNWNAVYIEHSDGSIAWYGHLKKDRLSTKPIGSLVDKGEFLGIVASSGCSTGPHLHFEISDSDGKLIDPFAGPCNDLNSESWWTNQPAYHETSLIAILTHNDSPVFACPTSYEKPNISDKFYQGDDLVVAVYFRDIKEDDSMQLRIKKPDGTLWKEWEHSSPYFYPVAYFFWEWNLPLQTSTGDWTFEAQFKDEKFVHEFQVIGGINPDVDNDGFDYTIDCNDQNASVNPDAIEICDYIDNNCDGQIDEGVQKIFYFDNDGDGFGDPNVWILDCFRPSFYVLNSDDCDDNDRDINPDVIEICDDIDNNCDGQIDESLFQIYYADIDQDGFGDPDATFYDCFEPVGYVVNQEDCNDNDPTINPAAIEVCDGIDNNCDGQTDEGLLVVFYLDLDGDGFGDPTTMDMACEQPKGSVLNPDDCDDNNESINPFASEVCDSLDNNCNDRIDEGLLHTLYADMDGDGFGDINSSIIACEFPDGYVINRDDCDDSTIMVFPNRPEICDGLDNNCNGEIDEGVLISYYADVDEDGFGDPENAVLDCVQPDGFVENNEDCDDANESIFPDASELCDGLDNNCNGEIDEGVLISYYADVDQDGFGDPENAILDCVQPGGFVLSNEDCDDANESIFPDASEICDGLDNNCNGEIDEGVLISYYADVDEDGFGDPDNAVLDCVQPDGFVENNEDCDDAHYGINPEAIEIPDNGIDEDCDGTDLLTSFLIIDETDIEFYPNPANSLLIIKGVKHPELFIKLLNTEGKLVFTVWSTAFSDLHFVNISDVPGGIYLLELSNKSLGALTLEKLVISK